MKKFVAYYRVSTRQQGDSGLGLSAQKSTVGKYIQQENGVLLNEYTEIETGTNKKQRFAIYEAIIQAKKENAVLVISKIDRLSRNLGFLCNLRDAGVEFVACDMPTANNFTLSILMALAEQEAILISQRTKSALQELKAKGVKLGTPQNLSLEAIEKGREIRTANAKNNTQNKQATAMVKVCREKGMTFQEIADHLNELNFTTRRGCKFKPMSVKVLFDRTKEIECI